MAKKKSKSVPDVLKARIAAIRKRLRDDVDGLLVTNPRDIRYLTGFIGDDSWAFVPMRGRAVTIVSDSRFEEQIQREAPQARVIMRKAGLAEALKPVVEKAGAERVGLQSSHVTLAQRKQLARHLGASRLSPLDDKLVEQRAVKTPREIRAIRRALAIQQQAFEETLAFVEPGMPEQRVAAYLEYRMRSLGADGRSFPTIVAADANASLPHAIPGKKKIRKGGIILIDWGARFDGYCSDLTRVVAIGKMRPKLREIYQIVLDAQLAAIDAIKPGVSMREVDAAARNIIRDAGYGKQFGHGLGHGIGLDIHEQPVLSPRASKDAVLEPGHVVTVEPGIYLPGVGGVRIEDDVLVKSRGNVVLSDLPKSLESAII